ncbi:MAG: PAS domain-containing protein, partial [Planctomycetota bacterium]
MPDSAPPADRTGAAAEVPDDALIQAFKRSAEWADGECSPEATLEAAVELICESTGWPLGHVVLPAPRSGGADRDLIDRDPGDEERTADDAGGGLWETNIWRLAPSAEAGEHGSRESRAKLADLLRKLEPGPLPGGCDPHAPTAAGRAFALGEPVWGEFTPDDPDEGDLGSIRSAIAAAGLRRAHAVPVVVRGTVAAVCEFFSPASSPSPRLSSSDSPPSLEAAERPRNRRVERAAAIAAALARQAAAALANGRLATRLAERERDLNDLFETAAAGLALLEPDGTIRRSNRAFAHMLGYPAGALDGRPITELLAPGGR